MPNFSALLKGDVYILLTEGLTALFPRKSIMKAVAVIKKSLVAAAAFSLDINLKQY